MQILHSLRQEQAMSDATYHANTVGQRGVHGPGPRATGRLAYQDDQYMFGFVAEIEQGLLEGWPPLAAGQVQCLDRSNGCGSAADIDCDRSQN